jgi:UDP-N-acetylmuramoyl-tripeptide--D-alanyl-D-alanine ligase
VLTRTLAGFAECVQGRLAGADLGFGSVSTDTRSLAAGSLFVALAGPNHDGHDYVNRAAERGAVGAVVAHEVSAAIPQIVVHDPLAALSVYAAAWRREFSLPVVGVTGSNGKTTTKTLIGAMLERRGPCHVTQGNLNNHIGVPLTLLGLEPAHRTAVIEMGANHLGEIAGLARLAQPTIGLVTNAGPAHLEGFGSLDGVARGKGELYASLGAGMTAVINADDAYADLWRELAGPARVVGFGLGSDADFTARDIVGESDEQGPRIRFRLVTPDGDRAVALRLPGRHNVRNALGAAASAAAAGATLDQILAGLEDARAVHGRLELKRVLHGAQVIDDSYNANPGSFIAGLDALADLPGEHWLVLGEMRELGPTAAELHAQVGRHARNSGVTRLLAFGAGSQPAVEAFGRGAARYESIDDLIAELRRSLDKDVAVLVKGSRSNRLERVVAALDANEAAR